ncbi:hypothetical protein GGI03_003707, partial [Coemansia sp. RSA 2337]
RSTLPLTPRRTVLDGPHTPLRPTPTTHRLPMPRSLNSSALCATCHIRAQTAPTTPIRVPPPCTTPTTTYRVSYLASSKPDPAMSSSRTCRRGRRWYRRHPETLLLSLRYNRTCP